MRKEIPNLPHFTCLRFWEDVDIRDRDDCWPWCGPRKKKGYGRFYFRGKWYAAHRVAFAISNNGLKPELDIDHTCRFRDCVNPHHLEAVTQSENRRRRHEARNERFSAKKPK
ncbi:MAG: HNH endonuclease [Gammaproteobacteria bacterium]|nr:HNH endonuclease [Gammaproteobacteria bacterium]